MERTLSYDWTEIILPLIYWTTHGRVCIISLHCRLALNISLIIKKKNKYVQRDHQPLRNCPNGIFHAKRKGHMFKGNFQTFRSKCLMTCKLIHEWNVKEWTAFPRASPIQGGNKCGTSYKPTKNTKFTKKKVSFRELCRLPYPTPPAPPTRCVIREHAPLQYTWSKTRKDAKKGTEPSV